MSDNIKKGLMGVTVDETAISKVMPEINSLTYRGYAAQDLCANCQFEEVAYLILNGELPNKKQLKKFIKEETKERSLSKGLINILKNMPKKSHPMDVARTAVSFMGLEDKETTSNTPEANLRKTMRIFSKTPTALAAFYRLRKGKKIIAPKKKLSFAENFFHMCFGKVPNKDIVKAFDVSLILYAEHSFNVSTFTARTITSSLSDIHGAIAGAIASLKGPLHGGANTQVMQLLTKIGEIDQIEAHLEEIFTNKEKIMGFGHRVYKTMDPRASILKNLSQSICKQQGQEKFYIMSEKIHEIVSERKGLNPNVDFYSASLYHALGISHDMFTVIFSISRMAGWSAHILEQVKNNRLIRPRAHYSGHELRDFIPMNQR